MLVISSNKKAWGALNKSRPHACASVHGVSSLVSLWTFLPVWEEHSVVGFHLLAHLFPFLLRLLRHGLPRPLHAHRFVHGRDPGNWLSGLHVVDVAVFPERSDSLPPKLLIDLPSPLYMRIHAHLQIPRPSFDHITIWTNPKQSAILVSIKRIIPQLLFDGPKV